MVKKSVKIEVENEPEQEQEVLQPEPVKANPVEKSYTTYAPFSLLGREFAKGETFNPPFYFQLDNKLESVERKGRPNRGTTFVVNGQRVILPVE